MASLEDPSNVKKAERSYNDFATRLVSLVTFVLSFGSVLLVCQFVTIMPMHAYALYPSTYLCFCVAFCAVVAGTDVGCFMLQLWPLRMSPR